MKPSCRRVLDALRAVGPRGLDAYDDFDLHGQGRLAARITDLKAEGYDIASEWVTPQGRSRRAVYRINEQSVQRPTPMTGEQTGWASDNLEGVPEGEMRLLWGSR